MENKKIAGDISICANNMCPNKCQRHQNNWIPEKYQSYCFPTIEVDDNGELLNCTLEWRD